jgi:beta-lactamase class A
MSFAARFGFVVALGVAATLSGAAAASPQASKPQPGDGALAQRLRAASRSLGGTVGIAIIHVETGRTVEVQGARPLPLYSVFKLPLAVAILKDAEDGRLRLDQKVRITPSEVVQGAPENTALWKQPTERTIRELLDLSIARSDNTSTDKLVELAGGPGALTRRLSALGITGITVRSSVREFLTDRSAPHGNTASALDLARLLSRLQKGEILRADSRQVLFGFMAAATTGLQRLRAGVPAGTPVADKTGSGPGGSATNDVGIITLPGVSHLAVAVLVSGSKRPMETQEKLIADVARAAYDAYAADQPLR